MNNRKVWTVVMLPEAFCNRMKHMLQEEYDSFEKSYMDGRYYGLRYNPLKNTKKGFEESCPFTLTCVPWAEEGYYYKEEERPGKHLLHEAGAYYIQEPSAMAVVEALEPQPGEMILDLCAAPGGKTTQIGGRMKGKGLLISNEIVPSRAKILAQNVERMGISNCIVCNEDSEKLSQHFPAFFDRIVVDAPCSGEGMFRKDETAVQEWSPDNVIHCGKRQDIILENAAKMLKPGGIIVYSTCTFAPVENEGTIARFLEKHPDWMIEPVCNGAYFAPGRTEWIEQDLDDLYKTVRLWPHKIKGEGHYIARIKKPGTLNDTKVLDGISGDKKLVKETCDFLQNELEIDIAQLNGKLIMYGDHVTLIPNGFTQLKGLRIEKPGVHIAVAKKNRWEPDHAFAMSCDKALITKCVTLSAEEGERYLKGESLYLNQSFKPGWNFVCSQGYILGFGKVVNNQLKNHYPKGLRKN